MNIFNIVDINILSLILVAFIYVKTRRHFDAPQIQSRIFAWILVSLAALLVIDSVARAVNRIPGGYVWNVGWNFALFLTAPVPSAIWLLYCDYHVHRDATRLKRLAVPVSMPFVANMALTIFSLWTGWSFSVNAANVYSRGPLFPLHAFFCYVNLFYSILFVFAHRKRIDKRYYASLLTFFVPVTVGSLMQTLFYGLVLSWSSMTLSALLIYFNVQDNRLDTDYLTGAYNRRLVESYLRDKVQRGAEKRSFSAILLDLDHFKEINDTLGHKAGDDALTDAVALLKSCLRHGDFVSRYGGDEFLVILDIDRKEVLQETVIRLREAFRQFNEPQTRPYTLSFSSGYDVYDMGSGMAPAEFIEHVDKLMYEEKKTSDRSGLSLRP